MYMGFTVMCHNKGECNEVHAYISFVPASLLSIFVWWLFTLISNYLICSPFFLFMALFSMVLGVFPIGVCASMNGCGWNGNEPEPLFARSSTDCFIHFDTQHFQCHSITFQHSVCVARQNIVGGRDFKLRLIFDNRLLWFVLSIFG